MPVPGTCCVAGGVGFSLYAPRPTEVLVELVPSGRRVRMEAGAGGWRSAFVPGVAPGDRYRFVLVTQAGEVVRPDPASRYQPEGVHGPSEVVAPDDFHFTAASFRLPPLEDAVLYELHVGAFTPEGTFAAVIPHLDDLRRLGVRAVEIMPVAAFPGTRGWGYDGVDLWAPLATYGGPEGLWRLVDACHAADLGVLLDVVYNHFGPEGCYLRDFGDYFDPSERTPWGDAVRLRGPGSDAVRSYFVENAAMWVRDYRVDGLRLDAVHMYPEYARLGLCADIATAARAAAASQGRDVWIIGESDLNEPRFVLPAAGGGGALDAAWSDDLHHALHALLTGERHVYYADFGRADELKRALERGFVYDGTRRSSYRGGKLHGGDATKLAGRTFVVCSQNHDQVGNRPQGERLASLVGLECAKLAAVCVLAAAPNVPLLFMGEEYAERAPFYYFTDFGDPALAEAVRAGRRREMGPGSLDPQALETFLASRLDHSLAGRSPHREVRRLYEDLLALRTRNPALAARGKEALRATVVGEESTVVRRPLGGGREALIALSWAHSEVLARVTAPPGTYRCVIHSADVRYAGPGAAGFAAPVSGDGTLTLRLAPESAAVFLPEATGTKADEDEKSCSRSGVRRT